MRNMSAVDTVQLSLQSRFRFRCHKAISCFTRCCSNIDIMLTPYDIVVLKERIGITSEEFLDHYTYIKTDDRGCFPLVFLRMKDDARRSCPFVTPEGCSIYEHRPANCRYYPVGQGTLKKKTDNTIFDEEFYFFVREKHCKGFGESSEWTVAAWREDQGVDRYDEYNREWKGILLVKNRPGIEIDERKQGMFAMACYDMDRFRRFIFDSRFLQEFDVDEEVADRIRTDDRALMSFGFRYMKYILMMEETLKRR